MGGDGFVEEERFNGVLAAVKTRGKPLEPYYARPNAALFNEDCLEILSRIPEDSIDLIFADPPYMLSNGGITCRNGRMAAVNKGGWDRSRGFEEDSAFHGAWIAAARRALKPEGTLWISGTYHSIYQCGYMLQKTGFHILNDIAWFKPNAPPNLSCRFFTASHETLLWARKDRRARHVFNYREMKNGSFPEDKLKKEGAQMRSVWSIPAPRGGEKKLGGHPAQKPLDLLLRILRGSTLEGGIILDPFNGSGTTALAALSLDRRFYIGAEIDLSFCELTQKRLEHYWGGQRPFH
jgi:site-specific DNA-methyltransferase (adenine-specific)